MKPSDKLRRSLRGGTRSPSSPYVLRGAALGNYTPGDRHPAVGFRTVQSGARMPVGKVNP